MTPFVAIGAAEAHSLVRDGKAVMIDVRTHGERIAARIPGTLHIPLDEFLDRLDEVPRDRTVILQCASGARSAGVCAYLARAGHPDVRNLHLGILGWHQDRLPLERGA